MTLREKLFEITDVLRDNPNCIVQDNVVRRIMELLKPVVIINPNPACRANSEEETP